MYRHPPGSPPFPYTPLFHSQIVELGVGTYNSTYRVELADGEPVILRIAPEPAHAGPASPEAMRNEYATLPFLAPLGRKVARTDRKSTRLNSSHANISYAVFC